MSKPAYGATLGSSLVADLVALYLLNEPSGSVVHDLTASALNSTSSAGLDWTTNATKLTLDGSSTYAGMGTDARFGLTSVAGRSWECIFNLASVANGITPTIMHRMDAGPAFQGWWIGVLPHDHSTSPDHFFFATANFGVPTYVVGPPITTGADYHILVTQEVIFGGVTIYLNGSPYVGGFPPNPSAPGTTNFEIGRHVGSGDYFPGTLDKIAVYSAVLTSGDAASLYADPWQQVAGTGTTWELSASIEVGVSVTAQMSVGMALSANISVKPNVVLGDSSTMTGMVAVSPEIIADLTVSMLLSAAIDAHCNVQGALTQGINLTGHADGHCNVTISSEQGVHAECFISDGVPFVIIPPAFGGPNNYTF